jgi:putative PIN family toxin of toxin-antitoxin system
VIRAVLDANVVVSSLINPQGIPAQVLDAWRAERFQVVLSAVILDEIGRVLRYPRVAVYHR